MPEPESLAAHDDELAANLRAQPQLPATAVPHAALDVHANDPATAELHEPSRDHEAPTARLVRLRLAHAPGVEQVARDHVAGVGRGVRLEAELVVVALGRLRQQRPGDADLALAEPQLADRD